MPTLRKHKKLNKPWHARAKRMDLEYSLGYYATWEEARAAEIEFLGENPTMPKGNRHNITKPKEATNVTRG